LKPSIKEVSEALSAGSSLAWTYAVEFNLSGCHCMGAATVGGEIKRFGIYDASLSIDYKFA
jgi:hypothetical protein